MRIGCGAFSIDTELREIRDSTGVVRAEPRVFDLLVYLMTRADRMVTREELLAGVWSGRVVSDSAIAFQLNAARRLLGDDGTKQGLIRTFPRKGVRFVGEVSIDRTQADESPSSEIDPKTGLPPPPPQEVRYCHTKDGVRIAFAASGHGPVLVRTPTWFNHIEYDWRNPLRAPLLHAVRPHCRHVRYDGRGTGLSDRECTDLSFEGFLRDLDAVVETLRLPRYGLLGISSGAAVAIAHAARRPDRISFLVLHGAYGLGRNRRGSPRDASAAAAFDAMLRAGWGDVHSAFLRAFSSVFVPDGTPQQIRELAAMQRAATSGDIAAALRLTNDDIDIVDCLARIKVPTLVLHCTGDQAIPFTEGQRVAERIPGARFIGLASTNHIPLAGEPAWPQFVGEIIAFMREHG